MSITIDLSTRDLSFLEALRAPTDKEFLMPLDTEPPTVRYVDADDFGANALAWMVVVHASGHVVLTVEGLPFARVEPIGAPIPDVVAKRNQATRMT